MVTTSINGATAALPTELAVDLVIDAVIAPKISFVTHQNAVPVLRELRLVNLTEAPVECIALTMEADPPVFARREWRIDRIGAGGEIQIAQRDLPLNAGLLLQLTEGHCQTNVAGRARWW